MNDTTIDARLSGAYVHWNAKPAVASTLEERLSQAGYGKWAPKPRTAEESLRMAMCDQGAGLECRVRKGDAVKNRYVVQSKFNRTVDGFELVQVAQHTTGTENGHEMVFTAVVTSGVVTVVETGPRHWQLIGVSERDLAHLLQEAYDGYHAEAAGSAVGRSLVTLVGMLNGTAIKEDGGLYYLPDGTTDEWEQIAQAFEACGNTTVGCALIQMTDRTAREIRSGITKELKANADVLLDELMTNDCSERMVKHRLYRCQAYRAKAMQYEGIIGGTLSDVRKVLDRVDKFEAATQAIADNADVFADTFA